MGVANKLGVGGLKKWVMTWQNMIGGLRGLRRFGKLHCHHPY
jgi:hypothetical protein